MEIRWIITKRDTKRVSDFVNAHRKNAFVQHRIRRNLKGQHADLGPATVWAALVNCLLTTQQRSGPRSHVYRFITTRPSPLRLSLVSAAGDPHRFTARVLRKFGGIRRVEMIGREVSENLPWFHGANWRQFRRTLEQLTRPHAHQEEREVAEWLRQEFRGLGPKQSRNFLQVLGLSQYEIPIDSRITKWLNDFGFPVALTSTALSDPAYYAFVADGFRELSRTADVAPCILDAAIFSSADGDAWESATILW
jgi:hypothetical protein